MNNENLNKLLENYIASFDVVNNEEHQEYYKWEAIKHFENSIYNLNNELKSLQ